MSRDLDVRGCPVASYSDKHSVFRINRVAHGGSGMTRFCRALAGLNIEIRLVGDLRLANVCLCHREQRYLLLRDAPKFPGRAVVAADVLALTRSVIDSAGERGERVSDEL